jgi:hypothetical protein
LGQRLYREPELAGADRRARGARTQRGIHAALEGCRNPAIDPFILQTLQFWCPTALPSFILAFATTTSS